MRNNLTIMNKTAPGGRTVRTCLLAAAIATSVCSYLTACTSKPLIAYSTDTPPLALVPAERAGIVDRRARFREIYCAVLEAHGPELPDYRPCEDALTRVGSEPAWRRTARRPRSFQARPRRGSGSRNRIRMLRAVVGPARDSAAELVRPFGYEVTRSRSTRCRAPKTMPGRSATRVMAMPEEAGPAASGADRVLEGGT